MPSSICRTCGQENPDGARFCLACGEALVRSAVGEERKVVSALFVDLVGYTELAERLDPEQVAAVQEAFWEHVRGELERRSGTVEKYVGDAVLALFGAPAAHEDDPERAVRAALAIRDWAAADPATDVRVGVATGEALVRLDARPLAGEGTAVGDVVNTAARLQQAAPVNAVLVDAATREATADRVDYRAAAAVAAKGKAHPVRAWEALAVRAPRGEAPVTRFVGRGAELALLAATFRRAVDQHSPQLVTIVGPPGIGKTRLVQELRGVFAAGGSVEWLHGRAQPYDEGAGSLWALAESVKRYAGILETDAPEQADAKLARMLASLFDDPGRVAPHVRALVGMPAAPEALRDQRVESFAAWRALLEAIASRRPLVLALDDLQWADPLLLEFVDHLVEWAVSSPLLVVCTARPELQELRPSWGAGKPNALTMSLGPLTDDETARLLGALLGVAAGAVPPDLRVRVGGNPLYAEQFARMVAERGGADVPRTVQAVIGARIDALAAAEKRLLEDAAVVGEVFWPGAVGAEEAGDVLHRLERKELIVRRPDSTVAGETEYAFRHVLLRDVAYARIPRARRSEKHVAVAEWLAGLGRAGNHADELAHHYGRALDAARAAGAETGELAARTRAALRLAGERAIALNAFAAAVSHLRGAAELWPRDDPERAQVLLRLGHARWVAEAEGEAELREARDALRAAGDRGREAEAEGLLCELYWYRGDLPRSWRHLDAAASLVEDAPASPQKAYVLARLSRQLMLGASYTQSIAVGREALELAERFGIDELRSATLNSIGSARARSGDVDGIHDVELAAEISLGATSRAAVVAYNNLGSLHGELGDLRTSNDYLRRARSLAEELGDRGYLEWSDRELAARALQSGDWDAVVAGAERLDGAEPHYLDAMVRVAHALVLQERGDARAAAGELERAAVAARRVGDPQIMLACLADCALVALLDGRTEEALAHADEVAELAASTSYLPPGASFPLAVVLCAGDRAHDLTALLDGFPQRSRWFDAARAYARGDLAAAAALYAEIGDAHAEAFVRAQAGDPSGAAFFEQAGARAPAFA